MVEFAFGVLVGFWLAVFIVFLPQIEQGFREWFRRRQKYRQVLFELKDVFGGDFMYKKTKWGLVPAVNLVYYTKNYNPVEEAKQTLTYVKERLPGNYRITDVKLEIEIRKLKGDGL